MWIVDSASAGLGAVLGQCMPGSDGGGLQVEVLHSARGGEDV